MRVGLVVPGFSASTEDWCIPALRHLARSLARTDDVRVIAVRYPYRAARYTVDGAEVIALGGAATHSIATLAVWRRTLDALRAEHRRHPFDVLHAFWATESGLLAAMAGQLLRIPTLVSLAGGELVALPAIAYGDQRLAWERLKIRASLRLATAVGVGSRYLRAIASQHVEARRLHLAPLGVDLDLFSGCREQVDDEQPRLIHVGTLTPVKDQTTLLQAFATFHRGVPRARLDIAGDGPLRPRLEQLVGELGLADAVRFLGGVDHAALARVYRSGSAFVLSSRHEAQAMVAVEAAACGLAVVGTSVGVIPELATSGASVCPVGDSAGLATALAARETRPAGAAEQLRAEFGLEACTTRFRTLYASLAQRGQPAISD